MFFLLRVQTGSIGEFVDAYLLDAQALLNCVTLVPDINIKAGEFGVVEGQEIGA